MIARPRERFWRLRVYDELFEKALNLGSDPASRLVSNPELNNIEQFESNNMAAGVDV